MVAIGRGWRRQRSLVTFGGGGRRAVSLLLEGCTRLFAATTPHILPRILPHSPFWMQGHTDIPLNENGRAQAACARE